MFGAPNDHLVAVLNEGLDHILEVHQHGPATHKCDVVHREGTLQGGVLIQGVQHNAAHGILFEDNHNPHTLFVTLVVDVRNALNLLLVDHLGNLLYHIALVDHIGYLGDNDALPTGLGVLNLGLGPHNHTTPTGLDGLLDTLIAVDDTACGEVGTLHIVAHLAWLHIGIVDVGTNGITTLREVVGSHIGSHTHSDTVGTIDHQQGDAGGQYGRLQLGVIEVVYEVNRVFINVGHYLVGNLAHSCLGITHSRRRVAVHRTEVTLTVNQRVTQAPRLCHTTHCVIHGAVAVGVELTEHVADDTRTLTSGLVGVEAQLVAHIVEDTAVYGLHTIPCVGQRTRYNYRHRVVDVGCLHLIFDVNLDDSLFLWEFFRKGYFVVNFGHIFL